MGCQLRLQHLFCKWAAILASVSCCHVPNAGALGSPAIRLISPCCCVRRHKRADFNNRAAALCHAVIEDILQSVSQSVSGLTAWPGVEEVLRFAWMALFVA
mgnify:CR=1 FL=1